MCRIVHLYYLYGHVSTTNCCKRLGTILNFPRSRSNQMKVYYFNRFLVVFFYLVVISLPYIINESTDNFVVSSVGQYTHNEMYQPYRLGQEKRHEPPESYRNLGISWSDTVHGHTAPDPETGCPKSNSVSLRRGSTQVREVVPRPFISTVRPLSLNPRPFVFLYSGVLHKGVEERVRLLTYGHRR